MGWARIKDGYDSWGKTLPSGMQPLCVQSALPSERVWHGQWSRRTDSPGVKALSPSLMGARLFPTPGEAGDEFRLRYFCLLYTVGVPWRLFQVSIPLPKQKFQNMEPFLGPAMRKLQGEKSIL